MNLGLAHLLLDMAESEDRRRERVRRNRLRWARWDAFEMPERDFIKTFRLNKDLARSIINDVSLVIERERRRDALSVESKVLLALSFFATGSYQTLVGQSIYSAVSQPTVSRAVRQVTLALNSPRIYQKYVVFPTMRQDRDKIKRSFYEKYQMPGAIGCIDGTHVAILKPTHHEERYFNRKGYHSLNVMIICDLNLNILCVDPSHPGSTHDSTVWRDHPLNEWMKEKYNQEIMYLLGDSGYPLRTTMMTPYLNAREGSPEAHYYNTHVSARNVVERCIGVLKARFRCLLAARKLHYNPVVAGQIVNACAVLHNLANTARIAVPTLSREELTAERSQQYNHSVVEDSFRNDTINIEAAQGPRRVNIELQQGRVAQQALIQRLWTESNNRRSIDPSGSSSAMLDRHSGH